jgi:acetyltransferase-like isoleucine patch superfamily enzyme
MKRIFRIVLRFPQICRAVYQQVQRSLELRAYNDYTIAEYFRKQGARIGAGCYIIPRKLSTEPYLVTIGNHVAIANGVTLITHDGGVWVFRQEDPNIQVFGPIVIEDNCIIGQNAVIFPHVRIGANSIIGAGSVVIADVPPGSVVMGVPARVFGSVDKYREKSFARWQEQMPPGILIEPGATWWNSRHFHDNRKKLKAHLIRLFELSAKPTEEDTR